MLWQLATVKDFCWAVVFKYQIPCYTRVWTDLGAATEPLPDLGAATEPLPMHCGPNQVTIV